MGWRGIREQTMSRLIDQLNNPADSTLPTTAALSRRRFLALAATGAAGLVAARISGAEAQGDETPAQIAVDAGRVLWRIPATVRGFNFQGTRSDAAFMPEYRKLRLGLLRFPPGQAGDQEDLSGDLIDDSAKVTQALGGELEGEGRLRGGTPEKATAPAQA